jgi:hypothetical protein
VCLLKTVFRIKLTFFRITLFHFSWVTSVHKTRPSSAIGTGNHTTRNVLEFLKKTFGKRIQSNRFPRVHCDSFKQPSASSDLKTCDVSYGHISWIKCPALTLTKFSKCLLSCGICGGTKWRWGRFSPSSSVSLAIVVRSTNYSTITLMYHPGNAQ